MLAIAYAVSGSPYDFVAYNADGLVWDGSAWVAWADVDFEDYRILAAEVGESGRFIATLPDDTARYAMRASGADLAGSYLVWEEVVGESGGLTPEQAQWLEETHAKAMLIGTGGAFVDSPIDGDSNITVRRSRDYQQSDGLAIEWSNPDGTWPDLTGATVVARVARPGCKTSALYDFAASVVTPTGSQIVRLELTKAQLAIIADDYTYELVATLSGGSVVTLVDGQFRVILGRDAP